MATEEERKYAEWTSAQEGGGFAFFLHFHQDLNADFSTHQIELDRPAIASKSGEPIAMLVTSPGGVTINKEMQSTLKRLYAAGETAYGQHFPSSTWAFVTGARAGHNAGIYSLKASQPEIDKRQMEKEKERIYAPLRTDDGVTWQDMNTEINNIMKSYFRTRPSYSLELGLQYLDDLGKLKLQATNPHELMRCMETLSLLTVAEFFLRAASFPRKPEEWRILNNVDGEIKFSTRPIKYKYPIEMRRSN
jgi:succinate dehydrogenase/fumarate reductase flavoprotein subunit